MDETRRLSRRSFQRQIGAVFCKLAPRSCRSHSEISNFKFHFSDALSTRQSCRIEFALSPSRQRLGVPAARQFSERKGSQVPGKGSLGDQTGSPIFEFRRFVQNRRPACPEEGRGERVRRSGRAEGRIFSFFSSERVSSKTRCFSAQLTQNKRSEHETSVNFSRSVFPRLHHRRSEFASPYSLPRLTGGTKR